MILGMYRNPLERATKTTQRVLLIVFTAAVLAVSCGMLQEPMPVHAAPAAVSSSQQDRRPDRERPVTTTAQGSGSGFSSSSSGGGSTTHARPRLVRR